MVRTDLRHCPNLGHLVAVLVKYQTVRYDGFRDMLSNTIVAMACRVKNQPRVWSTPSAMKSAGYWWSVQLVPCSRTDSVSAHTAWAGSNHTSIKSIRFHGFAGFGNKDNVIYIRTVKVYLFMWFSWYIRPAGNLCPL